MFTHATFEDDTLLFHTEKDASQSGASTTLRLASVRLSKDEVQIGAVSMPIPVALARNEAFLEALDASTGTLVSPGKSKSPRKRPDWPIVAYKYPLWLHHDGIKASGELPAFLQQIIATKREFWNALCDLCTAAIEQGQPVPADVIDGMKKDVDETLKAFNDTAEKPAHKLKFPEDDTSEIPARRIGAYIRFAKRLEHLAEEGKPVPEGLRERLQAVLAQYPQNWGSLQAFEKNAARIGVKLAAEKGIPATVFTSVLDAYVTALKRRRSMKLKGLDGLPRWKDERQFDWSFVSKIGHGGLEVEKFNQKGDSSLYLGDPVAPANSGHPLMMGRKTKRELRPIELNIEGQRVTFAILIHRPLPEKAFIKQWSLVYRDGKYSISFILETEPYKAVDPKGEAAGLDINWRVTEHGIRIGWLATGSSDTAIYLDLNASPRSTEEGGMVDRTAGAGNLTLRIGPSRWGRNNVTKGVNYGVPDTHEGGRIISKLRDEAKDELKRALTELLGDDSPSNLSNYGLRGLRWIAEELKATRPEASALIEQWIVKDDDFHRVQEKLWSLLSGRMEKGYEQLAIAICRDLAAKNISRIAIEEHFLKTVAEAEKKYQPVALQKSARYRQSAGLSVFIGKLKLIGLKFGINVVEYDAAYTTSTCRFCGGSIEFGDKLQVQCPDCNRLIDQDENAGHNLRGIAVSGEPSKQNKQKSDNTPVLTFPLKIARVAPDGEIKQRREILITVKKTAQKGVESTV